MIANHSTDDLSKFNIKYKFGFRPLADSTLIHVFYSDLKVFKYNTQQLYSYYEILGKFFMEFQLIITAWSHYFSFNYKCCFVAKNH